MTVTDDLRSAHDQMFEQEADPRPRRFPPPVRAVFAVLALAVLALGVLFARGWRPMSTDQSAKTSAAAAAMPISAEIEAKYGIRFTLVNVTAGGGMIQIHYQVLDSDKVEAVHGTELAPFIVDSHGAKYADPGMVGHSHVGKTQSAGATDYILLADAQGGVKHGSTVTIKVGELELRDVPVE